MAKNNIKNSDKILNHVISRINQKMNLDSKTNQQISEFITERITGGIKIEFANDLPVEGEFEYAEFWVFDYKMKKHTIQLAYGDNPVAAKFPKILYVVIKEVPVKSTGEAQPNFEFVDVGIQKYHFDIIISGIIARIETYLEKCEEECDEKIKEQIKTFLDPLVDGKVWIVSDTKITVKEGYAYKDILTDNNVIKLAYASNVSDGEYPNILYVQLEKIGNDEKFRKFCESRYLPRNIINEAIPHLDLNQSVTILVFERAGLWRESIQKAKNPIVLGQKYDYETGNFRITYPIGYVDDTNILALTAPNECLDNMGICYIYN